MGLKAGWIALFIFVWTIGVFLGSTFDYQTEETATGVSYFEGTATFTTGSNVVTSGAPAVWTSAMEDGNIQSDTDEIWCKIKHIGGGYLTNSTGIATGSPLTLDVGANAVDVTQLGDLRIYLPVGNTGTATSGVCTVVDSPVTLGVGELTDGTGTSTVDPLTLVVGDNTVTVTGLGTFIIVLPAGNTALATSGVCTVDESPVALVAGTNTITTLGIVGNFTITAEGASTITTEGVVGGIDVTTVGSTVIFLYSAYPGDGGAGMDYTMRPTPGWAGTGTGGYATSPIGVMQDLLQINQSQQRNVVTGAIGILTSSEFWGAAFKIVTWQWSFMADYQMLWTICFLPFVVMGALSMILLVYGVVTGNLTW